MTEKNTKSPWTKISSIAGIVIGIAGIGFLTKIIIKQRTEVAETFHRLNFSSFALSVLLAIVAMMMTAVIWGQMLKKMGNRVTTLSSLRWYFSGQLGKYVPGGIWAIVGRAEVATRDGIPRRESYSSTGMSMFSNYSAALLVAMISAVITNRFRTLGLIGLLITGVVFVSLRHSKFSIFANFINRKILKRKILKTSYRHLPSLVLLHLPTWALISLSTSVLLSSLGGSMGIFQLMFITSLSWFIGFVVIGVPGGIGIRESVFTTLCVGHVSPGVAISLALASRFSFIAADVLGAIFFNLINLKKIESNS